MMHYININNILVKFPYKPYDIQINYMDTILKHLTNKTHVVLESPTGTGKTISILAAVLSWIKHNNTNTKIYYVSRTHLQLSQTMTTLKKFYGHVSANIMVSRDTLCINRTHINNIEYTNTQLCKANTCIHKDYPIDISHEILDIEDLISKAPACPYYLNKTITPTYDITFVPYNYLFESENKPDSIILKDSIIIIDEAHNIESATESSFTFIIKLDILDTLQNKLKIDNTDIYIDKLCTIIDHIFSDCTTRIKTVDNIYNNINNNITKSDISNISTDTFIISHSITSEMNFTLNALLNIIHVCLNYDMVIIKDNYKIVIDYTKSTYELLCISPIFGLQALFDRHVHSILMTSATTTNISKYISNIHMDNSYIDTFIIDNHIIPKNNMNIYIFDKGIDNVILDSRYTNRPNVAYIHSVGITILEYVKIMPGGIIIYFTSYTVMNNFISVWGDIFNSINDVKKIFIESQNKTIFTNTLTQYIEHKNGIFMAVINGKLSEGIDLPNNIVKGIIFTGIPFLPCNNIKVQFKKNICSDWYIIQAYTSINQAIGRLIRNAKDYGIVLIFDNRFDSKYLSKWMIPHTMYKDTHDLNNIYNFYLTYENC